MKRTKNAFVKRLISVTIACCVLSMSLIGLGKTVIAKAKPTSGVDNNGNKWAYDKENKTLTFSGTKDIGINYATDGESAEPAWFAWKEEAKVLKITPGITGLMKSVFDGFDKLEAVILPDSVTYIGDDAFEDCMKLKRIKMSKNILKIGADAFDYCYNLKSIEIPDKVNIIGSCAFISCYKLMDVSLPNSVERLGSGSFAYCKDLRKVRLPENLQEISEDLFMNCRNLKSITIPKSIKKIRSGAFAGTGIGTISIPVNVNAFEKNWEQIGTFEDCKNLKKVIIKSKKLTRVDKTIFDGFNKKAVIEVPKSKLTKYRQMFYKSGLSKKVKIKAYN